MHAQGTSPQLSSLIPRGLSPAVGDGDATVPPHVLHSIQTFLFPWSLRVMYLKGVTSELIYVLGILLYRRVRWMAWLGPNCCPQQAWRSLVAEPFYTRSIILTVSKASQLCMVPTGGLVSAAYARSVPTA